MRKVSCLIKYLEFSHDTCLPSVFMEALHLERSYSSNVGHAEEPS